MAKLGSPQRLLDQARNAAGGPERLRAIVLLSCVLALDSADLGTLGAVATGIERGLRIGDLELGVLASIVSAAAALATLPVGWLTDRVPRVPLLAGSIGLWGAAMVASALSSNYTMLLITRVFLGAVQATSGPTLAALTGDLFPARERGGIFSFIHTGELLGAGFGFVVSGEVAALLSWRWAFAALAIPAFGLAIALWRRLPEPQRGGAGRLWHPVGERDEIVHRLVAEQHVAADEQLVLRDDPRRMPVRRVVRYVLAISTNVMLIASLALGYFFLAGARTFGLVFIRGHYHLGQAAGTGVAAVLGVGAVAGALAGGRIADRWLHGGRLNARPLVAAFGYLLAAAAFIPALAIPLLAVALPIYVLATGALVSTSAPIDAARLDVVPGSLWGRAEGIQTALRTAGQALAPVAFGFLADLFGRTGSHRFGQGTFGSGGHGGAQGLDVTFLVMLIALALAGIALLRGGRSYPQDAAAAIASEARAAEREPTAA